MHGGKRFVRVFCLGLRPFWIEVTQDNDTWLVGYEVDRSGDRISGRGFDQRLRRVMHAAIRRQEEWRENLTYAELERI